MYVRSVYKESPRHYLSIEVEDHKFWRFKTIYITTTLQNLDISLHSIYLVGYDSAVKLESQAYGKILCHMSRNFCMVSNTQHKVISISYTWLQGGYHFYYTRPKWSPG